MGQADRASPVQRVDTPLGSIAYRQAGRGAITHVLLHGIGSASASWDAQLTWSQDRSDVGVLAWDAPGYGASTPVGPLKPQASDYAARLWAWLDALSCGSPVVLVDGTHVVAHQSAANPVGGAEAQAMGKTRGGRNSKVMALTCGGLRTRMSKDKLTKQVAPQLKRLAQQIAPALGVEGKRS